LPLDGFEFIHGSQLKCFFEGQTVLEFDCEEGDESDSHMGIIFQEYCDTTDYCAERTTFGMIMRGFENNYHTGAPLNGFIVETYDPDENLVEYNSAEFV